VAMKRMALQVQLKNEDIEPCLKEEIIEDDVILREGECNIMVSIL